MRHCLFLCILITVIFFQGCNSRDKRINDFAGQNKEAFSHDTSQINKALRLVKSDRHHPDSALQLLEAARLLCNKYHLDSSQAEVLFWKGIIRYEENQYNEAIPLFTKSLEIAKTQNILRLQAHCLERLASIHLYTDDPYLALNLYYESLSISEKVADSSGIARVYNILGFYKGQSGQFDSGVAYLNKARLINQRLGDRRNEIENLGNLGYVYRTNGKLEEAENIYQSLVNELVSRNDSSSLPVIYYNMASFRQEEQKLDSAILYLRKASTIAEATGDIPLLSTIYGNTGEILISQHKLDSAKVYLEKCFDLSTRTDDVETQLQALSFLIKIDTLTGQSKDAVNKYIRTLVLQDSVNQRKLRHNKETSELKYENDRKKNLIDAQLKTIEATRMERYLFLSLAVLAVIALVLSVIIFILKRRNFNKDKKLFENQLLLNEIEIDRFQKSEELNRLKMDQVQRELLIREKELTSTALMIEQKNEVLNEISKKISEKYHKQADAKLAEGLNDIVRSIKLQMNDSDGSDLFNQQFTQIHDTFFDALKKAHPDLTKTELKFCAYLRVHLSSNQIAHIMNVTHEAIRKTRYRIRKKLNLPVEASLEDYIMRF
jgi:tetratricopeptide (TPR) repeat protein